MPGEKEKRHGQAMAAASLPARDESALLGARGTAALSAEL
jgi:hypothetical protein